MCNTTLLWFKGGMKAVVWTDVFQATIILVGVVMTTVGSLHSAGGLGSVWRVAGEHGRLDVFKWGRQAKLRAAINAF